MEANRRHFIITGAVVVGTWAVPPLAAPAAEPKSADKTGVDAVSPNEDLMQEHGALNRILLIYEESLRRMRNQQAFDPALLARSATLVRDFIEGHHERLEEDYVFPRLRKSPRFVHVLDTLMTQHRAGRKLTATVIALSTPAHFKNAADISRLETSLTKFIRMYRPHEAREDTEVFPAFKEVVTQRAYDEMGERFEEKEHRLFGGFDKIVGQIVEIEKALGMNDLSAFTPT